MSQLSNNHQQTIDRMKRTLGRADDQFALFFGLVSFAENRAFITAALIEQLKRPVSEFTVSAEVLQTTTLDAWLLPKLKGVPEGNVIFLYDFDSALPSDKCALRHCLQQLNWRRSALASIARPLVIWLPQYAIAQVAEYAPDFYDWYSNVYEFTLFDDGDGDRL